MRITGETITLITLKGGGIDDDGYPLPETKIKREINNCVIVPGGSDVGQGRDYQIASKDVTVLTPHFVEDVAEGADVIIRGESWRVAAPVFHHRSAFGTDRGGTEIKCSRRVTT